MAFDAVDEYGLAETPLGSFAVAPFTEGGTGLSSNAPVSSHSRPVMAALMATESASLLGGRIRNRVD